MAQIYGWLTCTPEAYRREFVRLRNRPVSLSGFTTWIPNQKVSTACKIGFYELHRILMGRRLIPSTLLMTNQHGLAYPNGKTSVYCRSRIDSRDPIPPRSTHRYHRLSLSWPTFHLFQSMSRLSCSRRKGISSWTLPGMLSQFQLCWKLGRPMCVHKGT